MRTGIHMLRRLADQQNMAADAIEEAGYADSAAFVRAKAAECSAMADALSIHISKVFVRHPDMPNMGAIKAMAERFGFTHYAMGPSCDGTVYDIQTDMAAATLETIDGSVYPAMAMATFETIPTGI